MANNKTPVSFDCFKKFTYHKECVDKLIKLRANGDQQLYESLMKNKEVQEKALKAYYEAFYLRPKIREKYHIRFKPAPKSIADKLLSIPLQDTCTKGEQDVPGIHNKDIVKGLESCSKHVDAAVIQNNDLKALKSTLATPDTFDGDNVLDDDEPVCSPNKSNDKNNTSFKANKVKTNETKETSNKNKMEKNCKQKEMAYDMDKTKSKDYNTEHNDSLDKNALKQDSNTAKDAINKEPKKPAITNLQQTNVNAAVSTSSDSKNPTFNYKALIPYLHCCPLSFREFRKYSNIDRLVAEFCQLKSMDAHQQRMILHRSHLLFYLAPEYRTIPPINGIQLLDNCPLAIKEKFFNIPTNLYLKEKNVRNEQTETERLLISNNKVTQEVVMAASSSPRIEKQRDEAVDFNEGNATSAQSTVIATKTCTVESNGNNHSLKTNTVGENCMPSNNNNEIQCGVVTLSSIQNKINPAVKAVRFDINKVEINELCKNIIAENCQTTVITGQQADIQPAQVIQQNIKAVAKTVNCNDNKEASENIQPLKAPTIGIMQPNNAINGKTTESASTKNCKPITCFEPNNNTIANTETFSPPTATNDDIKFPVALNEFKKLTHYAEVVEKLLKLKAQGNEDLFLKYKNCKKACEDTLRKYYRAFYLLPAIRKTWPIRLKPMPSFKRNLLLQIPEGGIMAPLNKVTAEQLFLSDVQTFVCNEEGISLSPTDELKTVTKRIEDQPIPMETECLEAKSGGPASTSCNTNMKNNTKSLESNIGLKRTSMEVFESPSPKRQKTVQQNPANTKKSYKELLPYSHCCPVSYADFIQYSNVADLFTGYCKKRYNSTERLSLMLKRAYILYYLAPENRSLKPFIKLKVSDGCPLNVKEKFFIIPEILRKKETKNVSIQENESPETANQQTPAPAENNQQNPSSEKPIIEILENRLLPAIKQPLTKQSSWVGILCLDNACVFYHTTFTDIKQHTNIPTVQCRPLETTVLNNIFKTLIYQIINEQSCEEKYMLSSALTGKILKHKTICNKCEHEVQTFLDLSMPATSCSVSKGDSISNTSNETVIERCNVNNNGRKSSDLKTATAEDQQTAAHTEMGERRHSTTQPQTMENRPIQHSTTHKRKEISAQIERTETRMEETEPITKSATTVHPLANMVASSSQIASFDNPATSTNNLTETATPSKNSSRIAHQPRQDVTMKKSSSAKQTKTLANTGQSEKVATDKKMVDMWKDEKLFSKFCNKLLTKLQQSFDVSVDFCFKTYKMFIECNEIPLVHLLKDICGDNDDNVQSILSKTELFEALQRYYYFKYLTNKEFALKYPVIALKEYPNKTEENNVKEAEATEQIYPLALHKANQSLNSSNAENSTFCNSITIHDQTVKNASVNEVQHTSNNSALEKAKRIFFRHVDKTHTLTYVLHTTFGYKQLILRHILSLTFTEFLELTYVYEGKDLYNDKHLAECMFRYVCESPLVWPTNLFIPLNELCKFLCKKNISFDNYDTMLYYISPKILHWSDLLTCTNLLDCVKCDYEKRTGKLLDNDNISRLKLECIEYYNRCWKQEKWIANTPLVDEEFCKNVIKDFNQVVAENGIDVCSCENASNEPANILHAPNCVSNIIVLSPSEMNRAYNSEQDANELNSVLLANTQQQSEMLPVEQSVTNDALNNSNKISEYSDESTEVVTDGYIVEHIKSEPVDKQFLTNLMFYEDDNNVMQCVAHEEEIFELDITRQSQMDEGNLPASQIDFDVLMNSEPLQYQLRKNFASLSELNGENTQQFLQPSLQSEPNSLTHMMLFPDVNIPSSGEYVTNDEQEPRINLQDLEGLETVLTEILQCSAEGNCESSLNNSNLQETQCFSTSFKDTQTSGGSGSAETQQQEVIQTTQKTIREISDEVTPTDKEIVASGSKSSCKSSYQTNNRKSAITTRAGTTSTKVVATKNKKNVATVKPLPNFSLVPQIQHNTRPLQTVPAFTVVNSHNNRAQPTESEHVAPSLLTFNLTPTSNSQNSTGGHSSQNTSFELQLPGYETHIFISQELNKNCSVVDNSSLLRRVNHNYYKNDFTTNAIQTVNSEQLPIVNSANPQTAKEVTTHGNSNNTLANNTCSQRNENPTDKANLLPPRRVTRKNSQCLSSFGQPNNRSNLLKICNTSESQQPQTCRRIITRRVSSLGNNTNKKVNHTTLVNTNNVLTSITITINHQTLHPPVRQSVQMLHKVCLYRCISKFHYFKELKLQDMSKYLLPSVQIGKSYSEALVVCENFKTRVSNRSISALFPFWSQSLQRDFLLVLDDLKEFHYNLFEKKLLRKQEDLRARVLFWLLDTAPAFSYCKFIYERNNTEFSHCEAIQNVNNPSYERKPFKCLTNALNSKILKKLEHFKQ